MRLKCSDSWLMTVDIDRRGKFRKRPLSLVYVELASGNGGMMRDLCEEGFALRAMMPLRPGETTSFLFALDNTTRIEGEGRIIWVEEGGRVAGLEFTRISPEAQRQIQEWLKRVEDAPVRTTDIPIDSSVKNPTMEELLHEARTVATRPSTPKADVTVFPSPSRAEVPPPPREIPTPAELKKEIAEALRQASAERTLEEERPAGFSGALPPPPPPPEPPVPPAWTSPPLRLEPLPSAEELEFARLRRRSGFTLSRAIGIMLCIALAVGGYVYRREVGQFMIQLGEKISGTGQSATAPPSAAEPAPPTTQESSSDGSSNATNSAPSNPSPAATTSGSGASTTPSVTSPAATGTESQGNPANSAGSATTGMTPPATPRNQSPSTVLPVSPLISGGNSAASGDASAENGLTEYLQALQILRGKNGVIDYAEAARFLWIAVERGNSNAEVALAELYRVGQGVTRNCDQARVLLTAAARKGNPEGVKHLQLFEQEGCE
jgi:hypothetical protein